MVAWMAVKRLLVQSQEDEVMAHLQVRRVRQMGSTVMSFVSGFVIELIDEEKLVDLDVMAEDDVAKLIAKKKNVVLEVRG